MVTGPVEPSGTGWRTEREHDPSQLLTDFVELRDRTCDGPTQPRSRAGVCDLDHDRPFPVGPTAAWNLVVRSRRTHQLKHFGWTPVRTATATVWTSPAGQVVDVPHHHRPAPGTDTDRTGRTATLPAADALAAVDTDQLTPVTDRPPVLPPQRRPAAAPLDQDAPPW